jgi:hypothetical protein
VNAIIRIVPRVERGEMISVGVIVSCPDAEFLDARIEIDEARVLALEPAIDLDAVRAHVAAIAAVCRGGAEAGDIGALPQRRRFHWLVAPRSTMIQMSPVHTGRTDARDASSIGCSRRWYGARNRRRPAVTRTLLAAFDRHSVCALGAGEGFAVCARWRRGFAARAGRAAGGGDSTAAGTGDDRQSTGHCSARIALAFTAIVSVKMSAVAEIHRASDSMIRAADGRCMPSNIASLVPPCG